MKENPIENQTEQQPQNGGQKEEKPFQLTARWVISKLTALLFAAYAAYNIFLLFRDREELSLAGTVITAFVALLFGLLAVFAWTTEVKNLLFVMIRRTVFILALIAIFALKLNLVARVVRALDLSAMHTVLYAGAYFLTLAALLILLVYYVFVIKNLPLHPKLAVILPLAAALCFLASLVMEAVLLFGYGIGLEATRLRTLVIRPVFYLGFIGLSVFFLFPIREEEMEPESLL